MRDSLLSGFGSFGQCERVQSPIKICADTPGFDHHLHHLGADGGNDKTLLIISDNNWRQFKLCVLHSGFCILLDSGFLCDSMNVFIKLFSK